MEFNEQLERMVREYASVESASYWFDRSYDADTECPNCGQDMSILDPADLVDLGFDSGFCCERDYELDDIPTVFDIDYRVSAANMGGYLTVTSVKLAIAVGGPYIYLDTESAEVVGFWGGERRSSQVASGLAEEITSYYAEMIIGMEVR